MNGGIGELAIRKLVIELCVYLCGMAHQRAKEVSHTIQRLAAGPLAEVDARTAVACRYLPSALDAMEERTLAVAIGSAAPYLKWASYGAYSDEDIGPLFTKGHAFAALVGEDAPFSSADFDAGLFIIAPNIFYRDHHHAAPELYVPLTGPHEWRFGPNDKLVSLPAGHPVWNEPWQPHATRVGSIPFLCIYAWTKDISSPARVISSTDWAQFEQPTQGHELREDTQQEIHSVHSRNSIFG
jgi:hypothetical protein